MINIDKTAKPNIERLRTLYAMMAGIPGRQINLDSWRREKGDEKFCGTIACTFGWAATYPPFVAQGLRYNKCGDPMFVDKYGLEFYGFQAAGKFFGLTQDETGDLFGMNLNDSSHRLEALRRIRAFLYRKGAITDRRNQELMRQENAGTLRFKQSPLTARKTA